MPLVVTLHQQTSCHLADIEVQTAHENLCTGLIHWRDGGEVRAALRELEQLVNDQVLPLVDEVQERIGRKELTVLWHDRHVRINDLQVYADKDVSFRCDPVIVRELAKVIAGAVD